MAREAGTKPEAGLISLAKDHDAHRGGSLVNCPAPAKINLFLHVTGRRPDGYHLLQTVFQLLDHGDMLHFKLRQDGTVRRISALEGVTQDADLTVRAGRLLQDTHLQRTGRTTPGVDIDLDKLLPLGGGLGGGSSDAATTLMALNHLWNTQLSRSELMALGLQLGADVPFFIFGQNAFAEGIGETLTAVETPACWYVVIEPGVVVPTATIFNAPGLTRNTKPVRIADFSGVQIGFGKNDLQDVAVALHAPIAAAVAWLAQFGKARMTGSGACVFCAFESEQQADAAIDATLTRSGDAADESRSTWRIWKAQALARHPLFHLQQP
ncbi:MAG: 4-(cytidine 5'-diphospho)-2-C-methyl-D-erythritol kinase [Pseudomonadota bacterium]